MRRNQKAVRNWYQNVWRRVLLAKRHGFGPLANLDTEMTMKILTTDKVTALKLNNFIHMNKILEERRPGKTNNELSLFFPVSPFELIENTRKPLVFCFQGD